MTVLDFEKIVPVKSEPFPFTELQTKWIEALESGEYKQGQGWLNVHDSFCCLGVLCEVASMDYEITKDGNYYSFDGNHSSQVLPDGFPSKVGLADTFGTLRHPISWQISDQGRTMSATTLIGLNDRGVPFSDIAKLMRHDPWNVFAAPAA